MESILSGLDSACDCDCNESWHEMVIVKRAITADAHILLTRHSKNKMLAIIANAGIKARDRS